MEIDFEILIQLQSIDEEISKSSLYLKEIPPQIQEIDTKIEEGLQIVNQAKEKLVQNQKKRRDLEADVQDLKARIEKYKHQLGGVKTNLEYRSLLKEIEEIQKKTDILEEEIISEMLLADDIEKEIKTANNNANQAKTKLLKEKDLLLKGEKEVEEREKKLIQEKEKIIPKIPSDHIKLYMKIFNKKNGISLSPVTDDFCSMCHMRIRPQVLNELKERSKIILCENCGRILYWKKK